VLMEKHIIIAVVIKALMGIIMKFPLMILKKD